MIPRETIALVLVLSFAGGAAAPPELRRYDTPYYVVHTDLPPGGAAEAVVRMTRLGEDLRRRTRELGFTGRIDRRLPFHLYARHADYVSAGNPPETIGTFDGERLLAAAADARGSATWNVVQHEAFHQFAAATKGTELPTWLDEGLGEYFGEALFTGDGYVTGIVPAWRLARVTQSMRDGRLPPLAGFARLSREQWNDELKLDRYDQAWSIVQFFLHADGGAIRPRLVEYVRALADGKSPDLLDDAEIERRWKSYWTTLPPEGTVDLETEAAVATVTSFVARAGAQGQAFDSFDAFARAARDGRLRSSDSDWLPPSLLRTALERLKDSGIEVREKEVVARSGRLVMTGSFELRDGRVAAVKVSRAGG